MPWKELFQLGGTAVVALAALYFFVQNNRTHNEAMRAWGESRDAEREAAAKERQEERTRFLEILEKQSAEHTGSMVMMVSLAQSMVNTCQGKKDAKPVTIEDIMSAAGIAG